MSTMSQTDGLQLKCTERKGEKKMKISYEVYKAWKDQPILHDEDMWCGKYKTYGEMWIGEGYIIEKK